MSTGTSLEATSVIRRMSPGGVQRSVLFSTKMNSVGDAEAIQACSSGEKSSLDGVWR
jgi:hypothetical protein